MKEFYKCQFIDCLFQSSQMEKIFINDCSLIEGDHLFQIDS